MQRSGASQRLATSLNVIKKNNLIGGSHEQSYQNRSRIGLCRSLKRQSPKDS